ncbi:hypothetical protein ACHAQJ_001104 [Trichoderma viride]
MQLLIYGLEPVQFSDQVPNVSLSTTHLNQPYTEIQMRSFSESLALSLRCTLLPLIAIDSDSNALNLDARLSTTTGLMLRTSSTYCEAVLQPQDIYYEGSEDEDYDDAVTRKQRYEAAGQRFLAGDVPLILSATLKGPFDEESGWVNPWRSKNRTAHSQKRPAPQDVGAQFSPKRPATSASIEQQAIEALKSAECALPSPESLKQAPFTGSYSRPPGTDGVVHDWRDDVAPLPLNDDEFWATNSPSRNPNKRKSKPSRWLNSAANKRQRTESIETEIETPTSRRSLATKADANKRGTKTTRASANSSSIYSHIRELTSQLPPAGSQDLSSEDADTDDTDDHEAICTRSSVDLSLANVSRLPRKDLIGKILLQNEDPSSTLLSPSSQPSSRRAFSSMSISPAQTPTKRKITADQPSSRRQSSSGLSTLSEAPTNLSSLSDLEMPGVEDDDDGDLDNTVLPERQLLEEQLLSPEISETNDRDRISATPDPIPLAAHATGSGYEERPSGQEGAAESRTAQDDIRLDNSTSSYDIPRGRIMTFRATQSFRMADPLIYDDSEGPDQPASGSGNMALPDSQQVAPSQNEPINSPKLNKSQALGGKRLTKANSPHKSSPLRSLSPRNGRINSRPALKKIIQPYMSSLRKSPAANADEALHSQEEDGRQSKENVQAKDANENSPPPVMNTSSLPSQPTSLNGVATEFPCDPDHSKEDSAQAEPMDRDTPVLPITSRSNIIPDEAASSIQVVDSTQGDVLPNILEQAESGPVQQELSTDSQHTVLVEQAELGMLEMGTNGDTPEKPSEPSSIPPVTVSDGLEDQQKQQDETRASTEVAEHLVTPSQSIDTPQPPSDALPGSTGQVSKRPSTPEPRFAFTSFSTFMSPSPNPRRQGHYFSGQNVNGVASKSQSTLPSSMKKSWGSTAPKKRVSWAPLPHEETDSSGENVLSEMDTSSSMTRGRDRAVSPPPPPSTSLSSDSLTQEDLKFGDHFAAVADRSKGTNPQDVPTVPEYKSPSPNRQASAKTIDSPQVEKKGFATKSAKKTYDDDDEDPTDIVQDIFDEMDDFLQVWDVDAELNEARRADKARVAGKKETEAPSEGDVDMFASFL